jgi:NADP-dependent 3-hydroxy acid dehydrogenase YdfG
MADRLQNSEVVVVTRASAGLGRATVRAFAKQGARIGLVSRNRPRLTSLQLAATEHRRTLALTGLALAGALRAWHRGH